MGRLMIYVRLILLMLSLIWIVQACDKADEGQEPANLSNDSDAEGSGAGDEVPTNDQITIGFSMDTLEEERWLKDRELFKKAVETLGAEVIIKVANGNESVQLVQAETLISQGVDLLVIVPYSAEASAAIVNKAHLAGIKVMSYDRLVTNANIDLYISFNNEKIGEMQAKAITNLVPKGNYVYIGGASTDNNAHLLKKGVFNVLQPLIDSGDIKIVFDQWTKDWHPDNAFKNMEDALLANNNQIDAVIAANDATAGGVIQALRAQGLAGEIPVAGQDGDLGAIHHILEGNQTMTAYKPIKTLTEVAATLAVKLAKGEEIETVRKINNGKIEVPSVLLSPIAVDSFNIDETIIADGFHSRQDVYGGLENN